MAFTWSLPDELRGNLHEYTMWLTIVSRYENSKTVDVLVDKKGGVCFVEVNLFVKVGHKVMEEEEEPLCIKIILKEKGDCQIGGRKVYSGGGGGE